MGEPIPTRAKSFNTEFTDYSISHAEKTGPYADNLEVDALVVGAGFGTTNIPSFIHIFNHLALPSFVDSTLLLWRAI
ncbi:hypothetical protein BGZ61DRAFT_466701 [Ilyonectria robusta]|uniref:uncharacterized protein n=1 Tax=Ilyonectria robusta TaxID=1079257 RepID=UPI001E8E2D7F|nr:uncharacterized protein BGZ61DRAFT_466701 [Ilyonectria robusta]KAH8656373.1 hypothetical protein BGZ61DRAFT_466701 [Ilyonectria robusta]